LVPIELEAAEDEELSGPDILSVEPVPGQSDLSDAFSALNRKLLPDVDHFVPPPAPLPVVAPPPALYGYPERYPQPSSIPPAIETVPFEHPRGVPRSSGAVVAFFVLLVAGVLACAAYLAVVRQPALLESFARSSVKSRAGRKVSAPHALTFATSDDARATAVAAPAPAFRRHVTANAKAPASTTANSADDDKDDEPTPPPAPTPSTTAGSGTTTGVLRLPGSVQSIVVDGVPQNVVDGSVTLRCGAHMIQIPPQQARMVVLPCTRPTTL
jgi:hypothetical protein